MELRGVSRIRFKGGKRAIGSFLFVPGCSVFGVYIFVFPGVFGKQILMIGCSTTMKKVFTPLRMQYSVTLHVFLDVR